MIVPLIVLYNNNTEGDGFDKTERFCSNMGCHLLSIHTKLENDIFGKEVSKTASVYHLFTYLRGTKIRVDNGLMGQNGIMITFIKLIVKRDYWFFK